MRTVLAIMLLVPALLPGQAPVKMVCWSTRCVPESIVEATFANYQTGEAPPTSALRQDLITMQTQYANALKDARECQGLLGPLQLKVHTEILANQQKQLDDANRMAAPPGTVWDPVTRHYINEP